MNKNRRQAIAKARDTILTIKEQIDSLKVEFEQLQEEEQAYRDCMPENMENSERAQESDAALDEFNNVDDFCNEIMDLCDSVSGSFGDYAA